MAPPNQLQTLGPDDPDYQGIQDANGVPTNKGFDMSNWLTQVSNSLGNIFTPNAQQTNNNGAIMNTDDPNNMARNFTNSNGGDGAAPPTQQSSQSGNTGSAMSVASQQGQQIGSAIGQDIGGIVKGAVGNAENDANRTSARNIADTNRSANLSMLSTQNKQNMQSQKIANDAQAIVNKQKQMIAIYSSWENALQLALKQNSSTNDLFGMIQSNIKSNPNNYNAYAQQFGGGQ